MHDFISTLFDSFLFEKIVETNDHEFCILEYPRSSTESEALKPITGKCFVSTIEDLMITISFLDETIAHLVPNGSNKHPQVRLH